MPQYMPFKQGTKLAGMRVIPLVIDKAKMAEAQRVAGNEPLLSLIPYRKLRVGVITTGSEVYKGRIKDTSMPAIEGKLKQYVLTMEEHRLSDDSLEMTTGHIKDMLNMGMDLIICAGGMSVAPYDKTPLAIKIQVLKLLPMVLQFCLEPCFCFLIVKRMGSKFLLWDCRDV